MQEQVTVCRIHGSWLAALERDLLTWLAARMPPWVTPDHLTLLGVGGALLCGLSYLAAAVSPHFLWLAGAGLVINWFGDSLDGSLARYRRTERPRYGFFIDHSTDVISQAFIFLGLGASPYMQFPFACLALMSYWMAALYTFIRALATRLFQISYFGIGPTEIRLGLLGYTLAALALGPIQIETRFGPAAPLDLICAGVFGVVFLSFLWMVLTEGRRLAALDVPPRPAKAPAAWSRPGSRPAP